MFLICPLGKSDTFLALPWCHSHSAACDNWTTDIFSNFHPFPFQNPTVVKTVFFWEERETAYLPWVILAKGKVIMNTLGMCSSLQNPEVMVEMWR